MPPNPSDVPRISSLPPSFTPLGAAWRAFVPLAVGVTLALVPAPAGLAPHAWLYFSAFVCVITALILEPLAPAAIGLIGVTFMASCGLMFSPAQQAQPEFNVPAEAVRWALGGFANTTVWLIFGAFMFALGYEKTGLGRRIALLLVQRLGARTLGLGYAIMLADLALAPFTPSNTARSAGTLFPVIRSIPELYDSHPGESARRVGAYLMWLAFATTCVTSSMFVTALAPNLLAVELSRKLARVEITWTDWMIGFFPVGGTLLLVLPWLVYKLYPPEIKSSAEVPRWAAGELARLGRVQPREWIMAGLVLLALVLWIFGGVFIDASLVALVVIAAMVITRVVTWDDILSNRQAWNVLVWFATLVVLAEGLNKVGFIAWFANGAAGQLAGYSPTIVLLVFVVLFFVVHYLFASLTAHATAVLPVVIAAGVAVPGMSAKTFVLLLAFSLGIMGVITPYATGPAPVYFGSGYISRRDFWRLGTLFGAIFLAALLLIGWPWLALFPR